MARPYCWCLVTLLCGLMFPVLASAQTPQHPLDALRTEEYWTVYDVVQASGHIDEDTHYVSILLHEPAKDVVLAWKPGQSISREADVVLLRKNVTIEARVDIVAKKLESWKEVPGAQAPFFVSEIVGLSDLVLSDSRVKEALAKRGIKDMNTVECDVSPVGFFAFPEQENHRIGFADCDLMNGVYHGWGRSVSGLTIEVDYTEKKVLQVIDEGGTPEPTGPINFEEAPEVPRAGTKPGFVEQPAGPSFRSERRRSDLAKLAVSFSPGFAKRNRLESCWHERRRPLSLCDVRRHGVGTVRAVHGRDARMVHASVCG